MSAYIVFVLCGITVTRIWPIRSFQFYRTKIGLFKILDHSRAPWNVYSTTPWLVIHLLSLSGNIHLWVPTMYQEWLQVEQDLTNTLSSWGVHGTHPSHCMSFCMLFVSPNISWWKYRTEQNKYKALWHLLWNYPVHWYRLINQQVLLFRMTQYYQTESQFLHAHLWNLMILSVTLVK